MRDVAVLDSSSDLVPGHAAAVVAVAVAR